MLQKMLRWFLVLIGLAVGFELTYLGLSAKALREFVPISRTMIMSGSIVGSLLFGIILFFLGPVFIRWGWQSTLWVENRLKKAPVSDIIAGTIGLITGLLIGNLFFRALQSIPYVGVYLAIVITIAFGYFGLTVAINKREEFLGFIATFPKLSNKEKNRPENKIQPKILDTSVIIDGRIADICKSGFLEGTLVIPNFVLEELRHIADSSDLLKRNRGRRGLDILNKIQKELEMRVVITDKDFDDIQEVDSKLVKLAQVMGGKVVTNDFNLNKVAELQGVPVLNINELANAVKPVVLPGEEMVVHVIKDGKETGQGVAYLDDGTMIVVDGGKRYMNETIGVLVTSVLQTAAGRMIFAKPKLLEKVL